MIMFAKKMVINTPLQQAMTKFVRYPIALAKAQLKPDLKSYILDDFALDQAVEKLVKPGYNCIDIGCHIGSFLATFVRLSPQGEHIAFEPTPEKAAYLRSKFPKIELQEVALAEEEGEASFYINKKESGYNSLSLEDSRGLTDEIKVKVLPLDACVPADKKIDFVKIDVEGLELSVLKGGKKTFRRNKPVLIFESGVAHERGEGDYKGDNLFRYIQDDLEYDIFTSKAVLEGSKPLTLQQYRDVRTYPFETMNFIAMSRSKL